VGAIAGLVRLLADGRVPAEDHARVMNSLQHAAERAATLARDVGQIARWSRMTGHEAREVIPLADVLDHAMAGMVDYGADPVALDDDVSHDLHLSVVDSDAIIKAFTAVARAARRTSPDGLTCRVRFAANRVEVVFAPAAAEWPREADRRPFDVDSRGGLGLSVLLAATVVDAHGGRLFQDSSGAVIGVSLPVTAAT
jgi:signal transduction histidine kinase